MRAQHLPQNPEFKPTEKQLLSLLNAADSEYGPRDSSITWRVFMVADHEVGHLQAWTGVELGVWQDAGCSWQLDGCEMMSPAWVKFDQSVSQSVVVNAM